MVVPPLGAASNLAATLAAALSGTAQVVQAVATKTEHERTAMEGLAVRSARNLLPQLSADVADQKIASDDWLLGASNDQVSTLASQIARDRAGVENPDYRQAFHDSVAPNLSAALFDRKKRLQAENNAELGQAYQDAAVGDGTAAGIEQAFRSYMTIPGANETDAAAATGLAALKAAATAGDAERFKAAQAWLGTRFTAEQGAAELALTQAQNQKQHQHWEATEDTVTGLINAGQPTSVIRTKIDELTKAGDLNPQRALRLSGILDSRDAQQQTNLKNGVVDSVNTFVDSGDYHLALDTIDSAQRFGTITPTEYSTLKGSIMSKSGAQVYDYYTSRINASTTDDPALRKEILDASQLPESDLGRLDPQHAASLLSHLDSRAGHELAQASKLMASQWKAGLVSSTVQVAKAAENGGFPAALVVGRGTQRITLPNGTEATISDKEVLQAARDERFQQIAQETADEVRKGSPDATPEQVASEVQGKALPRMIQSAAANGWDVPEWGTALAIGATTTQEELTSPEGRKRALEGYRIYQTLKNTNKGMLETTMPQQAREFWGLVDAFGADTRTILPGGGVVNDPVSAMLSARKLMDDERYHTLKGQADSLVTQQDLSRKVANEFGRDLGNFGEALAAVTDRAKLRVLAGGSPDTAIDDAVAHLRETTVDVNGALIDLNYAGIPESVKRWLPTAFSQAILDNYLAKTGTAMGYTSRDLTMALSPTTGFFYVMDKASNRIVRTTPGDARSVQFSVDEIDAIGRDLIRRGVMDANGRLRNLSNVNAAAAAAGMGFTP